MPFLFIYEKKGFDIMSHFINLINIEVPSEKISNSNITLEWALENAITDLMEPFCECTEYPEYLEFNNVDEEIRTQYEKDKINCILFPNGSVISYLDTAFKNYKIKDNIIYEINSGRLKHDKRTKKAKKIKTLPNYPCKKLYPVFSDYAEKYCGYTYNKDESAYGYIYNPNAQWDWYQIGGRWPFEFLVKDNNSYVIAGKRSWATEDHVREAPEGYKWVAGARKSDIKWELMKSIKVENATKRFTVLEQWFQSGVLPEGYEFYGNITDEGISFWQDMLYVKGETVEEYLNRNGIALDQRLLPNCYSFIKDGEWISQGDMGWFGISSNEKSQDEWRNLLSSYLDNVADDDIIVTVDCHI